MKNTGEILRDLVMEVKPMLLQVDEFDSAQKPKPDKWSKKEILGHLIDSATNNHRRFLIANTKEDLVFEGYAQNEWVTMQDYQNRGWLLLIELWAYYNFHIADVIELIPAEQRNKMHQKHSFDRMAWQTVPIAQPSNLQYLINDYVGHIEHHIRQIIPAYEAKMIGNY